MTGDIQTYHCHFYSSREHILVFGHPDLKEAAFLSSQLLEINQELNNLTRELNKKNMELANQRAAVAERNRLLETDLRAAAVIQQSLLPVDTPFLRGLRFAYRFKPCDAIGGDIFHIFPLPGNKLGVYILDVSGHGTPAAMVSVCVHQSMLPLSGLVADLSQSPPRVLSPEEVLDALDREFPFERFETFFTICYAVIDPAGGFLSCSNAAHPPPVIIDPQGNVTVLERSGGIIGLDRISAFGQNDAALPPGSRLIMVTDGILDHGAGAAESFGFQRYLASLQKSARLSLDEQLGAVMADVEAFSGSLEAKDDMTLFGLENNPPTAWQTAALHF